MKLKIVPILFVLTSCNSQFDSPLPQDVNNYLIRTEEVIGNKICRYRNGAILQVEDKGICPLEI